MQDPSYHLLGHLDGAEVGVRPALDGQGILSIARAIQRRMKRRWSVPSRSWKGGVRALRRISAPGPKQCGTLPTRLNGWEQPLRLPSMPFALNCWLNSTSPNRDQ
jgi:hypothetical protein